MARDADYEDLQQQWNLLNFKFCLLIDMVSSYLLSSYTCPSELLNLSLLVAVGDEGPR